MRNGTQSNWCLYCLLCFGAERWKLNVFASSFEIEEHFALSSLSLVHSVDGIDRWWKYFEFQMTKYIWLGTYKTKEFISQLWCGIYTYLTTKKHITFVNGMVELSADSEFVECFYHHFHFLALSKRRTNFHPIFSGYMRTIFNLYRLPTCSRISYLLNHKTCDSRQNVSGNVR